jgi:ribosomal protein S6--L-glutamate ligase
MVQREWRAMKIALLSRNPKLYSTSRLVEAARARGHEIDVIDPIGCVVVIARSQQRMFFRGGEVAGYDVVIPRIGASITDYGLAVLEAFHRGGVACVNSPPAIARSRDKLRALERLAAHDVGIPRTAIARDPAAIRAAIDAVGGTPVIIKLLQGTQGVGVMIADSAQAVESTLDTLWGLGQNIILQEFIAESRGRDLRALVVGGEVVGAMRRTARAGEFRSNLHRGGAGQAVALDESYQRAAIAAARIIGLEVAGVDILESSDGPRVIEVNSSPGLRGIEQATEVDVAARIIEHAERLARERRPTAGEPAGSSRLE